MPVSWCWLQATEYRLQEENDREFQASPEARGLRPEAQGAK
jgi:hypothetical protein